MFVKLDTKKMRVESGTPSNPAKAAKLSGDEKAEQWEISRFSRFSSPDPSNSHFPNGCKPPCAGCSIFGDCPKPSDGTISMAELCRCRGAKAVREAGSGPTYPDESGRVKCFYCAYLDLFPRRAVCRKSRREKTGISLLTTCPDFIMRGTLAGKTGA